MAETPAISQLFERALQLPAGPERDKWVREKCRADEKLESDVLQMLRVHQQASGFLSQSPEFNVENAWVGRKSTFTGLQRELAARGAELDQTLSDFDRDETTSPDARYQLHGEIARGGMGAILKARDVDLGRSLAIKVLLESHRENEAVVQRFIEEAQIGGQLQHPGIAPVYELGQMPDDRPFFSMKLVKGDTLAALLKERKEANDDRAKLLNIFEQICQTMAYAHSRRVIHRDLKPANIMVGSFGEVQVMDWGLAKVLKVGGIADEQRARASNLGQSLIQTVRSGSNSPQAGIGTKRGAGSASSDTQAGSVMGTPAYMPPEQALGEVDRLDERCDVFGLGAILCEILTGQPPYVSDDTHELFRQAARGKLDECFARLESCGADETLKTIAKRCLEPEVEDRTRNARELSEQVTGYLESVEQRLRETEVERAAEATRAVEERKRRRITTVLATSAVLLCALCGAGWMWMQVQANQRNEAKVARFNEHLNNARLHQGLATGDNAQKRLDELQKATRQAKRAFELVERDGLGESRAANVKTLLSQLDSETKTVQQLVAQQSRDQRLIDRLELIRLSHADSTQTSGVPDEQRQRDLETPMAYATAFRELGIDLAAMDEDQIVKIVQDSMITDQLIGGLDQWAASLPSLTDDELIDASAASGDWDVGIALARKRLEKEPKDALAPIDLAVMLVLSGDHAAYKQARQQALRANRFPETYLDAERITKTCLLLPTGASDEFTLEDLPSKMFESALDGNRVQPSMKPHLWNTRALLAYRGGYFESCLAYVSESEALTRRGSVQMLCAAVRSMAEFRLGKVTEAQASFDKIDTALNFANAIPAARRNHNVLYALILREEAQQLIHDGKRELTFEQWATSDVVEEDHKIIEQYRLRNRLLSVANRVDTNDWRKKVRSAIHPHDTETLVELSESDDVYAQRPELISWLAAELRRADKPDVAVELLRQAYEEHPSDFWINDELGKCLNRVGQSEEALGYVRSALAIRPSSFAAKWSLSLTLELAGQHEASENLFSQFLSNADFDVAGYHSMADELRSGGHYEKAKAIIRKWIAKSPQSDEAFGQMSRVFYEQGQHEEAIKWAERALEINPDNTLALFRKAWGHAQLDQLTDAEAAYRRYLELKPENAAVHNNLGRVLQKQDRLDEAADLFRKSMTLDPKNRFSAANLQGLLLQQRVDGNLTPEMNRELRQLWVRIARDHRTAIDEYRKVLKDNPRDVDTRLDLARRLIRVRDLDAALAEATRAAALSAETPEPYIILRQIHRERGDVDAAIENSRKVIQLGEAAQLDTERVTLARLLVDKAVGRKSTGGYGLGALNFDSIPDDPRSTALVDEAIELLTKVNSTESNDEGRANFWIEGIAAFMLQRLLHLRGRNEEADQIVVRLPGGRNVTSTMRERAKKLFELRASGKVTEAIRLVEDHIAAAEDEPVSGRRMQMLLADLYVDNSREQDAIAVWERMAKDDDTGQAIHRLAQHYRSKGLVEKVEQIARDASQTDSRIDDQTLARIRFELAVTYKDRGRHEDELRVLREATEASTNPWMKRYLGARVYDVTGDTQKALDELADRMSVLPSVKELEALLLAIDPPVGERGVRLNQALALAKQASLRPTTGPRSAENRNDPLRIVYRSYPDGRWGFSGKNTLGIVHYRRGEYEEALKALEEFRELKFEEPSNWLFLAMTHWQLGDKDEARKWYAKATEFLDQKDYQPTRMEKLFRKEAEELIGEEAK